MGLIRRRANRWLAFLLTAASTSWVSVAAAQPEPEQPDYRGGAYFHPDLEHAIADWSAASGAAGYTALRAIWQTWDRAEPAQVEEALREAALTPRLSPPLRTYAELLSAYARLRRGDATEAQRRIAALGYVDQWLVLGPFDNTGKTGLAATQGPEPELAEPIEWGRGYPGKDGRQVRWRVVPPDFPYGWVDAGALLRPKQQMCAFFASYVTQPKLAARRPITLWVGVRGAYRLFWNGVERLSDDAYRGHDFDRRAVPVWLEPGENRVTVKVCGDDAAPMVSLRLADPRGAPDAALRWHADVNALTGPAPPAQGTPPPAQSSGPLDWFEREARAKSASPALREAFARYLQVSDGDDPATHQARDLAYAAAATPSVPRLLLAADLADDRNERARWLERARAALVHSPPAARRRELGDLLIAEAHQAEQGSSPQLALPLYDQALALDADDVDAIAGKARLYEAAGLKRSARAIIDRGLERNPHAVSLLNLSTSGLSDLGQTEAARSVESLYSAL
ncbi:MAG TPA: tetratricopeptide repeat protein, partial [Polyangiaceae bacterium]|nr:tetratricopeptide repeat protein [Polyangiaceae bacterium]